MEPETSGMLPGNTQPLDEVTGNPDQKERHYHVPIGGAMAQTSGPACATPKEIEATCEEENPKHIKGKFINDIIKPSVEFQRLRDSGSEMVNFQQRGSQEQHHKPRK